MIMDWDSEYVTKRIEMALAEDIGTGDVTVAAAISPKAIGKARIVAKQDLVCAGLPLAERVFRQLDPAMDSQAYANDGDFVKNGRELLQITGKAAAILTGERTALNFLGHLCGIATLTYKFVAAIAGTDAKIRDTRKTTPGFRLLDKYAVKMGGGTNHRVGLYDAILLKENHIALAGGVRSALDQAHAFASSWMNSEAMTAYEAAGKAPPAGDKKGLTIQIEVRNEAELRAALSAGAQSVLLDNMTPEEAKRSIGIVRGIRPGAIVEISGGITLDNVRTYALSGADYLSSGALTHSARAADLSLLVDSIK
jgi:nicotinate-nucleotide pyrophosphorylase (carboxylating)